ncbi:MAG: DUF3703 domain-containing protein [Actinobacteria bacterium]|jgi:hypothetical protein|nr:DUF3703 domain-containing protein [Actinomycetota bacterium]
MAHPTEEIRGRVQQNLMESRQARKLRDFDRCWSLLEDAHVLSQPWARMHVRVHGSVFVAAVVQRDVREVRGQLSRIAVAGPGSLSGRYPTGNTGRARVPATQPMPIAGELAEVLQRAGQRTD